MTIRRVRTILVGVAGTPWYSNLYFDADGVTPTPQQNVDRVGAFLTAIGDRIDNTVTWTVGPEVAELDETTGLLTGASTVTAATGAGSNTADPLPYMTQALLRFQTNDFVAGRRVRGRMFLPGFTEGDSGADGRPVAAALTDVNTAAATLIATGGPLVWARPFEGDPGPPVRPARAGSKAAITGASMWTEWAVLRSRRD